MKVETNQESFVGGEFGPSLFGRTDIAQYENACAIVQNMLIRPYGALISTPGTEFINDAKNSGNFAGDDGGGIDEDTYLLLHYDLTGQTFVDSSSYGHTVTVQTSSGTDPTIVCNQSTTQSKFGGSSCYMETFGEAVGAGKKRGWVNVPDSALWIFGGSGRPRTVDFWLYFDEIPINFDNSVNNVLFQQGSWPSTAQYITLIKHETTGEWIIRYNHNTGFQTRTYEIYMSPSSIVEDIWYHFAIVFIGTASEPNRILIFFQGTKIYDGVGGGGLGLGVDFAAELFIGLVQSNGANVGKVYFDEFRISGVARWTEDFIPPAGPYGDESKARLIPFVFSKEDSYIIETGAGYFRFYTDGAVVEA